MSWNHLLTLILHLAPATLVAGVQGPHLANGIKIGEVDQTSAVVWTRTTAVERARPTFEDSAPGAAGEVRVTCRRLEGSQLVSRTAWLVTEADRDFTLQVPLTALRPQTAYSLLVQSRPVGGGAVSSEVRGRFRTAPAAETAAPVSFVVVTCQALRSVDSGESGHSPYRLMPELDPDFFVHTGDVVYYDREPVARDLQHARWKWNRMYGFTYNRDFHSGVAAYFMKDDHDTLKNDCWPGQSYGELSWEQGLSTFREQVPLGEVSYRTFRWGQDVQVWLSENREFRSPNRVADGPEKTIWGAEQKAWFERTVAASDATFKFLIMPGPLVGPDKPGKSDNHANASHRHAGDELRAFVARQKNLYVICGDRHWQYWSVHPELGIHEFGCGPINDLHDYGGDPGHQPEQHRFFSASGGWLGVVVERTEGVPNATVRWYATGPDVQAPEVRFETTFEAR